MPSRKPCTRQRLSMGRLPCNWTFSHVLGNPLTYFRTACPWIYEAVPPPSRYQSQIENGRVAACIDLKIYEMHSYGVSNCTWWGFERILAPPLYLYSFLPILHLSALLLNFASEPGKSAVLGTILHLSKKQSSMATPSGMSPRPGLNTNR